MLFKYFSEKATKKQASRKLYRVCGNFETQKVLDMVESIIKTDEKRVIKRGVWDEPQALVSDYIEKEMPVAMPLFVVGIIPNCKKGYK